LAKHQSLQDDQEERGLAIAGCGMGKVIVRGEFFRQREQRYLRKLQFAKLVPLISSTRFSTRTSRKLAHILANIDLWIYDDWEFFAHLSECYTPLVPATLSFNNLHIEIYATVCTSTIVDIGTRLRCVGSFTPQRFTPAERVFGTHCIGGSVGPGSSLDTFE
jgi:hypothetical protein